MRRASGFATLLFFSFVSLAGVSCQETTGGPPPNPAPAPPPPVYPPAAYGYPPGYAPPGYPQPGYTPPPPAQSGAPPPVQTAPAPQRPMLGLLVGSAAWQAEVRAVINELVANLSSQNQVRVATVPIVLDPTANDVNAWAGCTDAGAPYIAGTEGLFEALDAISQTKATDELFGTRTYDAYAGIVIPRLASAQGSAALPAGVVPPQLSSDPRRISRAHEIFDELAAFTFGHELAHHYLGHTGCANGQQAGLGPALVQMEQNCHLGAGAPVGQPAERGARGHQRLHQHTGRGPHSRGPGLSVDGGGRPVAARLLRSPRDRIGSQSASRLPAHPPEPRRPDFPRADDGFRLAPAASWLTWSAEGALAGAPDRRARPCLSACARHTPCSRTGRRPDAAPQ